MRDYIYILATSLCLSLSPGAARALDDTDQLRLERAARVLASAYLTGNPHDELFEGADGYVPANPRELIDGGIQITVDIEHSLAETEETTKTIRGFEEFSAWLENIHDSNALGYNMDVRTLGRVPAAAASFRSGSG